MKITQLSRNEVLYRESLPDKSINIRSFQTEQSIKNSRPKSNSKVKCLIQTNIRIFIIEFTI